MKTDDNSHQTISARPAMTASIVREARLTAVILHDLVHEFYAKLRGDTMLGPIFAERITDWGPHLDRMVVFWSSVALMTGGITTIALCQRTRRCQSMVRVSHAG